MFARWWAEKIETKPPSLSASYVEDEGIRRAINARRVMVNDISDFADDTPCLPWLICTSLGQKAMTDGFVESSGIYEGKRAYAGQIEKYVWLPAKNVRKIEVLYEAAWQGDTEFLDREEFKDNFPEYHEGCIKGGTINSTREWPIDYGIMRNNST
ncbi:hypothetical protein N7457_002312 [Penicillium paradoxum]|uniref:uncharacterized protein n=1 Tax=Penicillium paradoxum TaxID=176176 RepID=UPI0025478C6A|nr:uncharacterized protein N7457_002312 [Penicillium paradoxum]KAJ5787322.1 hypothetical protein N7457_002312 [Penicillium paradoxum]